MKFSDILKKSFISSSNEVEFSTAYVVMTILIAALIGVYIYNVYRLTTKKNAYSKSFGISLVAFAMIMAAIIMTIQSNMVISLGMVGALSLVRFRTAIKEPMDMIFLLWSVSAGIVCGAGLLSEAVIASVMISIVVFCLQLVPVMRAPLVLVVNSQSADVEDVLDGIVYEYCKNYRVKSRNMTQNGMTILIELRTKKNTTELLREIKAQDEVDSVALLLYEGEKACEGSWKYKG